VLEVEPPNVPKELSSQEPTAVKAAAPWVDALSLAEGGLLADVAVLVDLVRVYLPVVGVVFAPLLPTPFALLMLRRGVRATLLAVAVAVLLMSLMVGPHYGWRIGVSGLAGLALGYAMKKKLRPALIVTVGIVVTTLLVNAFFFASLWALAVPVKDLVAELQNLFHTANGVAAFVTGHLGLNAFWQQVTPPLLVLESWLTVNWPLMAFALLFCWSVATVVLHYAITNGFMRFFGFEVLPFPSRRFERLVRKLVRGARWLDQKMKRKSSPPSYTREEEVIPSN
jgi:uncharacterized protein YybS (DUF2232 family)